MIPRPAITPENEDDQVPVKGTEKKSIMASLPSVKKSWNKKVAVTADPNSVPTAEDFAHLENFKDKI